MLQAKFKFDPGTYFTEPKAAGTAAGMRTDGAVARAARDYHQERLRAANRPSHPGPAAGPPVLEESAAESRTQSGPSRAPAGAEAGPAT
jgi:hypothetical protein